MSWLEDDDSNSRQSIKQILDQQEVCGTDSGTSRQQPSSTQGGQITTVSMPGFKLKLGQHRSSDPDLRQDLFKKDQHCFVTGERREDLKITPLIEVDAAAWGGANAVVSVLAVAHQYPAQSCSLLAHYRKCHYLAYVWPIMRRLFSSWMALKTPFLVSFVFKIALIPLVRMMLIRASPLQ